MLSYMDNNAIETSQNIFLFKTHKKEYLEWQKYSVVLSEFCAIDCKFEKIQSCTGEVYRISNYSVAKILEQPLYYFPSNPVPPLLFN